MTSEVAGAPVSETVTTAGLPSTTCDAGVDRDTVRPVDAPAGLIAKNALAAASATRSTRGRPIRILNAPSVSPLADRLQFYRNPANTAKSAKGAGGDRGSVWSRCPAGAWNRARSVDVGHRRTRCRPREG